MKGPINPIPTTSSEETNVNKISSNTKLLFLAGRTYKNLDKYLSIGFLSLYLIYIYTIDDWQSLTRVKK
jgi:hypothetical protein